MNREGQEGTACQSTSQHQGLQDLDLVEKEVKLMIPE